MTRISSIALALVLLAGCAPRVQPGAFSPEYVRLGPLELSAAIERDIGDLMGSVDIMNTGDSAVVVEYNGSCAVSIVLAMIIYYPFAKVAERQRLAAEAAGAVDEQKNVL